MLINGIEYKVALDSGPLRSGDSIRGIGFYTDQISRNLDVEAVDFSEKKLSNYNLIHFTRFNPFIRSLPFVKPGNTKFVLTVYDLIPLIYPSVYKPGMKGMLNWNLNKILINKYCDSVITISETSKKDICRFTGIDPQKVTVTYLAPRKNFKKTMLGSKSAAHLREKYGLPQKFVLYVGDINYNKNIPTLVKACKKVGVPLVAVGKQAPLVNEMQLDHAELQHLKNIDWTNVTRLGFVNDTDLNALYNLAHCYVQPSYYEGFGLPVLEAFAAGCPVVCSKTQALVEISGGACLFSETNDYLDFSRNIRLLDDLSVRKRVSSGQMEWVKGFTWNRTAYETKEVYKKILV